MAPSFNIWVPGKHPTAKPKQQNISRYPQVSEYTEILRSGLKQQRVQLQRWGKLTFRPKRFHTISKQFAQQESLLTQHYSLSRESFILLQSHPNACRLVSFFLFLSTSPSLPFSSSLSLSIFLPSFLPSLPTSLLPSAITPLCWCYDMKRSSPRNWVRGEPACSRYYKGPRNNTSRLCLSLLFFGKKPVYATNSRNIKFMFSGHVIFHLKMIF